MGLKSKIQKRGLLGTVLFFIVTPFYKVSSTILGKLLKGSKVNDKYIIFTSNPDFSDNAKALYLYYKEQYKGKGYKFIWFVSRDGNIKKLTDGAKFEDTIFVKFNSYHHTGNNLKAMYYIAKSKLIFFTHAFSFGSLKKKQEQLVINLWHGCGYKNTQKKDKTYIERYPFDYALVPGKVFIDTKTDFWGCKSSQIWDIGYPRYDDMLMDNSKTEEYVNSIKNGNKLIVWMPTFRKTRDGYYPEESINEEFDMPLLSSKEELVNLNKVCSENNVVLMVKRHPMQLKYACEGMDLSNIIFVANDDFCKAKVNLYSFLRYTDGLITDYSSIAIDYLLIDKPIAFSLDDFEKYASTRGFVFDDPKKYMPGDYVYNYNDMAKFIKSVSLGNDSHKEERQAIMGDVHNKCDNYCKRIFDRVKRAIK